MKKDSIHKSRNYFHRIFLLMSLSIRNLTGFVNSTLWDEESAYYYDLWEGNVLNFVKSIGAYWALLADVVSESRKNRFISHLANEKEFYRPHPIPTLSADHPE